MKDLMFFIMFFIGVTCWIMWFADAVFYIIKETSLLPSRMEKLIKFLAVILVILSWYIM